MTLKILKNKILVTTGIIITSFIILGVLSFYFIDYISKIKVMNELLPKITETVLENSDCTKILNIDVSYQLSTKDNLIFYADCGTDGNLFKIERYYISENDIKNKK